MEVNLKAQQDAGASTYARPSMQGGFSVRSASQTVKPSAEAQSAAPMPILKKPDESGMMATGPSSQAVLSEEELRTVTSDLTKFMQSMNTDIHFSVHEKSGRMLVQVVDSKTQNVLKEFPPEELLDTIGAIRDYVGALLDKKA